MEMHYTVEGIQTRSGFSPSTNFLGSSWHGFTEEGKGLPQPPLTL